MNAILWALQWLLAFVFVIVGTTRLRQSYERLAATPRMGWINDFSPRTVKLIGLVEVLGAIGLVIPPTVGLVPWLAPTAAAGLLLLMAGAAATHLRRSEISALAQPIMLGIAAAAIAAFRFGPESF